MSVANLIISSISLLLLVLYGLRALVAPKAKSIDPELARIALAAALQKRAAAGQQTARRFTPVSPPQPQQPNGGTQ
ncbi:hypothetical protein [Mycolicibacterium sphagni]|uniref:hypothetical protein n=1 Tax=Mycolicibacterium sphagni TaxID=1786 RepID=UPI0021F29C8E|nr:hypothetical protein [Mycolicibacterium sphagni]MCV7175709.1 hypothetical protein [Mycolicibacterium sphagni]